LLLFSFSDVELKSTTKFIMVGMPLSATSTVKTQTHLGPEEIRKASLQFGEITETGFDIGQANLVDLGNISTLKNTKEDLKEDIQKIIEFLRNISPKKSQVLISLGGDHFITYPIMKFLSGLHDNLGIIVFDAHLDQYDIWDGTDRLSHCTVMRRILEIKTPFEMKMSYVGIRDHDLEEFQAARNLALPVLRARSFSDENYLQKLEDTLKKWKEQGIDRVYLSIDIDVLDPGVAPGTGYRMPGGLTFWNLWKCLRLIVMYFNVIGFDIVEVDPASDVNSITSMHAAKIIVELMALIMQEQE